MRFIVALIVALVVWVAVVLIAGSIFVWSGAYNIGADAPHARVTARLIGALREHSIESRAATIQSPNLDDPKLVEEGAGHYMEMCTGCHLAPGMDDSEIRHGLYPKPPNLTRFAPDPSEAFWVIKHGIKMSGMPAWGPTHTDQMIWAMVAFLQQQPKMSAAQFRKLAASAAAAEPHEAVPGMDMPGMQMPSTAGTVAAPASTAGH